MNVVADAGAVRRRVIGAENVELRPQPQGRLGRNLNQMCASGLELRRHGPADRRGDVEIGMAGSHAGGRGPAGVSVA